MGKILAAIHHRGTEAQRPRRAAKLRQNRESHFSKLTQKSEILYFGEALPLSVVFVPLCLCGELPLKSCPYYIESNLPEPVVNSP